LKQELPQSLFLSAVSNRIRSHCRRIRSHRIRHRGVR
jgi:hypothetical protein